MALTGSRQFVTGHQNGTLRCWQEESGTVVAQRQAHTGAVFEIATDADQNRIASMGEDRRVVVSRLPKLDTIHEFDVGWGVRSVAFSPDGSLLAAAPDANNPADFREGSVDLWNLSSGKSVLRLAVHTNWVVQTRFFDRGAKLATLSVDEPVARLLSWCLRNGAR